MKPLLFLCLIAAVYLACFLWIGGYGAFWSEDAGVKYLQVVNLIGSHWKDSSIGYPGRSIDPRLEFNPLAGTHTFVRDGRICSIYPVAFSFLSSLLYARLGFPGLYLLPFLSTLAMIGLVYKIGGLILGSRRAVVASTVAAFSCPTFFYAFTFWEMNVAALLLLGGVYLVIRNGDTASPSDALGGGIIMGAAVFFREEGILLIASLVIVRCVFNRDARGGAMVLIGAGIAGVAGGLIGGSGMAHLLHNVAVRPREFGSIAGFIQYKWGLIWELLFGGNPNAWTNLALLLPWGAYALALIMARRGGHREAMDAAHERDVLAALSVILAGHCVYLWLCSTSRYPVRLTMTTSGLLMFSPWVAFGAWMPQRRNPLLSEPLWISVLCITLVCVFAPTSGGLQWGPRYLVIVYPLLALVSCASFAAWREESGHRAWLTALFAAFVLMGALNEIRGLELLKWKKDFNLRVMAALRESHADTVIAVPWWVPLSMAPAFYEKDFFAAGRPQDLNRLAALLRGKQRRGFILVAENDPSIIDAVAARCYLMPRRVMRVRMQGDDYFHLILAEYGLK